MGTDLDFWEREGLMIAAAPFHFAGSIAALIIPLGLLIWFLVSWTYKHRFDAKDDQLAARDERLTHAKENQQDAERKSKDLQLEIEKLEEQLQARASIEDIAITVSSAKTKADELAAANNAIGSAIGAARVSSASNMSVNVSLSTSPLPLRDQAEVIKSAKDG